MLRPEPAPLPYLDRVLARVAPAWALKRARERARHAALQAQVAADTRMPDRVRWIDGQRWVKVDSPPNAPWRSGGWRLEPLR